MKVLGGPPHIQYSKKWMVVNNVIFPRNFIIDIGPTDNFAPELNRYVVIEVSLTIGVFLPLVRIHETQVTAFISSLKQQLPEIQGSIYNREIFRMTSFYRDLRKISGDLIHTRQDFDEILCSSRAKGSNECYAKYVDQISDVILFYQLANRLNSMLNYCWNVDVLHDKITKIYKKEKYQIELIKKDGNIILTFTMTEGSIVYSGVVGQFPEVDLDYPKNQKAYELALKTTKVIKKIIDSKESF